ncbi:MAG: hypothetical protein JWL70_2112 [Acidimicrobiia bacterium]|nr:hypothetical protein [Acidimicrobiia bacterium]
MSPYRFLRTPKWIAFTLGILALMVLMLFAAQWQWHRYEFKRDRNHAVVERTKRPPVPAADLLKLGAPMNAVKPIEWTPVSATGSYEADQQVIVRDRSQDGRGGSHVVTPLLLADGSVLLVNRGFIDISVTSPPAPPSGAVTVVGRLRTTQTRGAIGPRDPATGHLTALARLDVARIAQQLSQPVRPGYVELTAQQPAVKASDPALIPLPDGDLGPHLSYMVQWIIFTGCAAVGWGIVVRRTAKRDAKLAAEPALLGGESGAHDAGLVRQGSGHDGSS